MSLQVFNISAALFAATAYASSVLAGDSLLLGSADVLQRSYADVLHSTDLTRRQSLDTGDSVANGTIGGGGGGDLNLDGPMTLEEWDDLTNSACVQALAALPRSTNPSGYCICYNLPSLNADTGSFEADLRMYRLNLPRDAFVGVEPENVSVDVFFNGAGAKKTDEVELTGMVGSLPSLTKRQDNTGPVLVRAFMLAGQIDAANMTDDLTMAKLEQLVLPTFTLTATTPSGERVATNVSINEASFLTGVFANQVVLSDFATAQKAVSDVLTQLDSGDVAFVLPGVQILIFPTGLIITGTWLLIGIVVYGYGTFERMRYAEMFKARKNLTQKRTGATI